MPATEFTRPDAAVASRLEVAVVDTVQGLTALQAQWDELLRDSVADCPFLTWDWMYAWWTHLREARNLRLLVVHSGDRLLGIAPLSVSRGNFPWLSRLEFLGTGCAGSDYLDVIVRRDREAECLEAMANYLGSQRRALHLDHLPTGARASILADRLRMDGWMSRSTLSGTCPYAKLADHSWESYVATLSASHQTRYRRYLGTLNKKFTLRFELVASQAQRQDILSALMTFHDQRWTGRGGSTAFQTPALRAFHHDATARALEHGWLRLFALRLNDQIAAVTYCFAYNGRFYLYQHGFDQQYHQFSVGLVALGLTIHAAVDEGASEFDMLYGDEPYKSLWARETQALHRIELFPAHIAGRLHHGTVEAERSMRRFARRIFPRRSWNSNAPRVGAAS